MTTATQAETVQSALNKSNANDTADLLARTKVGFALSTVKVTVTGAASATTQAINSLDTISNAAVDGIAPALVAGDGDRLPAIGNIVSLRVTAGTATGNRQISDVGGTPSATVATLSDDGTTLEFEAVITAYVLVYQPRAENMTEDAIVAAP